MELRKVQGYSNLRKDVISGSVINLDSEQYRKNKSLRNAALNNREEQEQVKKEVECIKEDIKEIKNLLHSLINNR